MRSKRYRSILETKNDKNDTFQSLISIVKKNSNTKFDESIDLSFQINNKQKKK